MGGEEKRKCSGRRGEKKINNNNIPTGTCTSVRLDCNKSSVVNRLATGWPGNHDLLIRGSDPQQLLLDATLVCLKFAIKK